jgi:ceramide synthetase
LPNALRFYWLGCNHFPPCNLTVSKGVLFFYALETGFYIQAIHFLAVHEVQMAV